MHRCLQIPEVAAMMISCLNDHHPALLAFALTCKEFLDPSMDVLWSAQDSLQPLMLCFPSAVVTLEKLNSGSSITRFKRAPTRREWDRVLYYASRIKELKCSEQEYCECETSSHPSTLLEDSIFLLLNLYRPILTIFPNIRKLVCENVEMMDHIPIFLGPKLTDITLYTDCDDLSHHVFSRLFVSLPDMCPLVRFISISGFLVSTSPLETEFYAMVSSLPLLEDITVTILPIPQTSFSFLSQSARLTRLNLLVDFDPGPLDISPGFLSLRSLSMYMGSLDTFPRIIKYIASTNLHQVFVTLDDSPTASLLEQCFKALLDKIELVDVSFEMECTDFDILSDPVYTITNSTLRPLLEFKQLCLVRINIPCSCDIDDSIVLDMALAWHNLQALSLISIGQEAPPKITAAGLLSLVKHCPELKALHIAFDANTVVYPPQTPERPCKLRSFDVGDSPISKSSQNAVVAYMISLFTKPIIIAFSGEEEERYRIWEEVARKVTSSGEDAQGDTTLQT